MFCSDGLCFQGLRVVLLDSDGLASSCLRTGGLVVAWGLREHLSRNALFPPGGDDGRPAKRQQQRQHPPFSQFYYFLSFAFTLWSWKELLWNNLTIFIFSHSLARSTHYNRNLLCLDISDSQSRPFLVDY